MWLSLLQALGLAWWVEVKTENPNYTYYFGPFVAQDEAEVAKGGYVEDLEQEGATNIRLSVLRMKPTKLTIEGNTVAHESTPGSALTGQA